MSDIKNITNIASVIDIIKNIEHRPDWDEYFMTIAYLISKRSSCDRLHVGCVIISDNRIISCGYNGHIAGTPHVSKIVDGHEQMTIHAETNAISDASKRGISVKDATAYITHYPCINCCKNLISSGIKKIIYSENYNNNPICHELYELGNITVKKY